MDLAGKYLVVWLSPEGIETFLGVPVPADERAMTTWTVAGQVVGEAGPGLWVRVKRVLLPTARRCRCPRSRSTSCGGSWSRRRGCTTRCRRTFGGLADPQSRPRQRVCILRAS